MIKLSYLIREIKILNKTKDEVYFIRVTTKDEINKKLTQLGNYWRFVESKNKLKDAIESNIAYVRNEEPYVIIGKATYDNLELEKGISKMNDGEMSYPSKDLFDPNFSDAKILFKGKISDIL